MEYKEICDIAKKMGMMPDYKASKESIKAVKEIELVCFRCHYERPNDADFVGSYLYYQSEQSGDNKNADGMCSITDDGRAVIGLSHELLKSGSNEFCQIVFLHEMAHLTEIGHNEKFMERFNELEYEYFMRNRRNDGKAAYRPVKKYHRW